MPPEQALPALPSESRNRLVHEDWVFDLFVIVGANPQDFSGVADISRRGVHRCKIVLCRPAATREQGLEELRTKCVVWAATRGREQGEPAPAP